MIFINNKYTNWYNKLIAKARCRNTTDGYMENHHVIPRSLGGNNRKNNIVRLTPREHFVCHLLLTKMTNGNDRYKMCFALSMLSQVQDVGQGRYRPSSKIYDIAKNNFLSAMDAYWTKERREQRAKEVEQRGSCHTQESLDAIIYFQKHEKEWTEKALENRLNNCLKAAAERKGKPWSDKRAATGYIKPSDEIMAAANIKRKEALLGRKTSMGRTGHVYPDSEKIVCEFCNKKLVPGYYFRYHGNNCKHKNHNDK